MQNISNLNIIDETEENFIENDGIDEFSDFVSNLKISPKRKSNRSPDNNLHLKNKRKTNKSFANSSAKRKRTEDEEFHMKIISKQSDAIIYCRCSTARQNQNNLQSIYTQVGTCIDYCNKNKFNVVDVLKDICEGHDMSKLKLNDIPDKYSNVNIIIADPSRMSRNITEANIFLTKCQDNNITIHFVRDDIVVDSYENYKKVVGLVCDAYAESKLMSKRLKTTFELKKKYGSYIGAPKFGYKIDSYIDNRIGIKMRKQVPDEEEQKVVEIINRLYFGSEINDFHKIFREVTGNKKFILRDIDNNPFEAIYYGNLDYQDIADLLNENNITKRDYEWTKNTVSNLLSQTEDFDIKYFEY